MDARSEKRLFESLATLARSDNEVDLQNVVMALTGTVLDGSGYARHDPDLQNDARRVALRWLKRMAWLEV